MKNRHLHLHNFLPKVIFSLVSFLLLIQGVNRKSFALDAPQNLEDVANITREFTVLISKEDVFSGKKFPLASGVIVEQRIAPERQNNAGENFKYKYLVLTNWHVIHPNQNKKRDNSPYYVTIAGITRPISCIHERSSKTSGKDVTVVEFLSNNEYNPAKMNPKLPDLLEKIYISGWRLSTSMPTFETTKSSIFQNYESSDLGYAVGTKTFEGMSGGPIVNSEGYLIGIHRGLLIGVPIKESIKIIDEYNFSDGSSKYCGCTVSLIGDCAP